METPFEVSAISHLLEVFGSASWRGMDQPWVPVGCHKKWNNHYYAILWSQLYLSLIVSTNNSDGVDTPYCQFTN